MKLIIEFKEFISRGNVVDMAVGVIIGGGLPGVGNSLGNDLFMPGRVSFTPLALPARQLVVARSG